MTGSDLIGATTVVVGVASLAAFGAVCRGGLPGRLSARVWRRRIGVGALIVFALALLLGRAVK